MLIRTFEVTELYRDANGDGRTVSGMAIPYNVPKLVSDDGVTTYTEVMRQGAFAKTIKDQTPSRIKLFTQHAHKHDRAATPIGSGRSFREDSKGLFASFHISNTAAGNDALEQIKDGTLDSFSVGMRPIRHREMPDGTVERTEVALFEVSLVWNPAYEEAKIMALREQAKENPAQPPVTAGMSLAEARRLATTL